MLSAMLLRPVAPKGALVVSLRHCLHIPRAMPTTINKNALVITDGGSIECFDLILKRRKVGTDPQLCIVQDTDGLASKGMTLPVPFLQKLCR